MVNHTDVVIASDDKSEKVSAVEDILIKTTDIVKFNDTAEGDRKVVNTQADQTAITPQTEVDNDGLENSGNTVIGAPAVNLKQRNQNKHINKFKLTGDKTMRGSGRFLLLLWLWLLNFNVTAENALGHTSSEEIKIEAIADVDITFLMRKIWNTRLMLHL